MGLLRVTASGNQDRLVNQTRYPDEDPAEPIVQHFLFDTFKVRRPAGFSPALSDIGSMRKLPC
jgi:hypothetical protein